MVPELTKIQTRIAQEFQDGDLGAIKRSTKAYEEKLLKAKQILHSLNIELKSRRGIKNEI